MLPLCFAETSVLRIQRVKYLWAQRSTLEQEIPSTLVDLPVLSLHHRELLTVAIEFPDCDRSKLLASGVWRLAVWLLSVFSLALYSVQ